MRCEEILTRLEHEYPLSCQEDWDNSGLLIGRRNRQVRRVFVALDVTEDTLRQAVDFGADLMITHHPLLFHSVRQITDDTFIGRRIMTLIENDIACYAMHTNFDVAGMAELNEAQLALEEAYVLQVTTENEGVEEGLGRVGFLPREMLLSEAAEYVRRQFSLPAVRCYGLSEYQSIPEEERIRIVKAAVCGGSGKSMVERAIEEGAQILVTGDIDYHTAIDALARGLYIIDAGHYGTECGFIDFMVRKLDRLFEDIEVKGARVQQPFTVV